MRCAAAALLAACVLAPLASRAETIAITHARIHSVSAQGVIADGTVLIRGERIVAVGATVEVPADARIIDAGGAPVTPGLFSAWSQLGLVEVETMTSTLDVTAAQAPFAAGFDSRYGVNPASTILPTARQRGVTRAAVFPLAGRSMFTGIGAVIQLGTGTDPIQVPRALAQVELGALGARLAGGARGAAWVTLLAALDGAAKRPAALPADPDAEALRAIVSGGMPLVVHAERAADILNVLSLPARYPALRIILLGATEGWQVAEAIARARIPVIVDSYDNLPIDFEKFAATQENAARLARAGVRIAIAPLNRFSAGAPHDARLLAQYAGNAAGNGLPWDEALAAVTLNPAIMYGVADRLGSLEPGKLADVLVWSGDPLEIGSRPTAVFIAGREQPLASRQTQLRDRYRNPADPQFLLPAPR